PRRMRQGPHDRRVAQVEPPRIIGLVPRLSNHNASRSPDDAAQAQPRSPHHCSNSVEDASPARVPLTTRPTAAGEIAPQRTSRARPRMGPGLDTRASRQPHKGSTVPAQPAQLERDLEAERHHLTDSRQALKRMREHAQELFSTGDKVAGDAYAAETLGRHLSRRIAELADNPDTPLFFGRLDFNATDEEHANQRYHVGRRHVTDEAGEPMVLDWRAPISRTFYQASARDPQGV